MERIALTLDIIGKIMIAYTALSVHYRVRKEHTIDRTVFRAMKREQFIGIAGTVLMVLGYVLRVFAV